LSSLAFEVLSLLWIIFSLLVSRKNQRGGGRDKLLNPEIKPLKTKKDSLKSKSIQLLLNKNNINKTDKLIKTCK